MNLKKLPKKLVLQGGTILDPLSGRSKKGNVVIERNKIKSVGSTGGTKGEDQDRLFRPCNHPWIL